MYVFYAYCPNFRRAVPQAITPNYWLPTTKPFINAYKGLQTNKKAFGQSKIKNNLKEKENSCDLGGRQSARIYNTEMSGINLGAVTPSALYCQGKFQMSAKSLVNYMH
jgi:hypothetical protein